MMLPRNLLYTGVTRGKRLVVLVGQRKALAIAVRNQGTRRRWAKLREHLAATRGVNQMSTQEAPGVPLCQPGLSCSTSGISTFSPRRSASQCRELLDTIG